MSGQKRDGVRVSVSGVPGWIADIDLEAGVLVRRVQGVVRPSLSLPAETRRAVRVGLEHLHPLGDRRVRIAQFIEGEVRFELTLDGTTVIQSFMGDGRSMDQPMEMLLDVARGRIENTSED